MSRLVLRLAHVGIALVIALLAAGCSRAAVAPAPGPRTPTAVVVALQVRPSAAPPPVETRFYRVPLDGTTPSLLATVPDYPYVPAPSADGHSVLIGPDEPSLKGNGLRQIDVVHGGSRSLVQTLVAAYGWDDGAPVALLGRNPVTYVSFGSTDIPFRLDALVRMGVSATTTIPLSADRFPHSYGVAYLGSDASGYYVENRPGRGPVWRIGRKGSHVTTVTTTTAPGGRTDPRVISHVLSQSLPPDTAGRVGVPVAQEVLTTRNGTFNSIPTVTVCRLNDFAPLRSIPLKPPLPPTLGASYADFVLDPSLTRCLRYVPVSWPKRSPLDAAIWESTETSSHRLVPATGEAPQPYPLGYVGNTADFVWWNQSTTDADVYLYQRATRSSRKLAHIDPGGSRIERVAFAGTVLGGLQR